MVELAHQRYFAPLRGMAAGNHMVNRPTARSGKDDWGTPAHIVEAARATMGGIDLDPASCALANETVCATTYYTLEDDGLAQPWSGRVFLNPPYSETGQKHRFIERLEHYYLSGDVEQAILVVPMDFSAKWGEPVRRTTCAMCCFKGNAYYYNLQDPSVTTHTLGTLAVYFGPHVDRFAAAFQQFGLVVRPMRGN